MRFKLTLLALLVVSPAMSRPGVVSSGGVDAFIYLFARTCMANFDKPEALAKQMATHRVLEGATSSFFLGGAEGTAWAVEEGGIRYAVALRKDRVCAVFAQHAETEEVRKGFAAAVGTAPLPLVATKEPGGGPNDGPVKTIAYAWSRKADTTKLLFTLTTSTQPGAQVQAMASMAVVAN